MGQINSLAHVLLIEDDPHFIRLLQRVLSTDSHQTYLLSQASNGEHACRALNRKKLDTIILDLELPDINGWQLLTHIKTLPRTQDVPVIIVSADGRPESVARGLDAKADVSPSNRAAFLK